MKETNDVKNPAKVSTSQTAVRRSDYEALNLTAGQTDRLQHFENEVIKAAEAYGRDSIALGKALCEIRDFLHTTKQSQYKKYWSVWLDTRLQVVAPGIERRSHKNFIAAYEQIRKLSKEIGTSIETAVIDKGMHFTPTKDLPFGKYTHPIEQVKRDMPRVKTPEEADSFVTKIFESARANKPKATTKRNALLTAEDLGELAKKLYDSIGRACKRMTKSAAEEWLYDLVGWILKGAEMPGEIGPAATLPRAWDKFEFAVAKTEKKHGKAENKENMTGITKMSARAAS